MQDEFADQSNFSQQIDVATLTIGETALKLLRYGAGRSKDFRCSSDRRDFQRLGRPVRRSVHDGTEGRDCGWPPSVRPHHPQHPDEQAGVEFRHGCRSDLDSVFRYDGRCSHRLDNRLALGSHSVAVELPSGVRPGGTEGKLPGSQCTRVGVGIPARERRRVYDFQPPGFQRAGLVRQGRHGWGCRRPGHGWWLWNSRRPPWGLQAALRASRWRRVSFLLTVMQSLERLGVQARFHFQGLWRSAAMSPTGHSLCRTTVTSISDHPAQPQL